ncbi:cysteine peptidase family C39 domain-containing protein [Porphyromonas macacae]|uniref:cysteine peptidase family C39 domain-containing protein n=1 Tax=Porphyromonas macacae TaxID=28115 RepID=UPI0035A10FDC
MILVKQRDSMDCGPSCLAMIIRHYGQSVDINGLRKNCDLGRDGVSLYSISNAAGKIGFKSIGGRLNFTTIAKDVPLPCIVHWNQNHFVVVYKIKKHSKGRDILFV